MPRFDSPSVFGALLDRDAGHCRFGPKDEVAPLSRRYEPGTLVLETTWSTETGWLVTRDALTLAEWSEGDGKGGSNRMVEADSCLIRTATCIDGECTIELDCRPRFGYGADAASWRAGLAGWLQAEGSGPTLTLSTDTDRSLEGDGRARGELHLKAGESAFCALAWGEGKDAIPRSGPEATERLNETTALWRQWLSRGNFPDHPWRIHLQRSALVLKGLTYEPTGAIVAAATTSLPEAPGGVRNWDYRFSWIRDSTFALWSLHSLGFDDEAIAFLRFVRDRGLESDGDIQIMYGIDGRHDLTESTLDHLSGYEGAQPVRVGNGAFDQHQHDVWGALMDAVYVNRLAIDGTKVPEPTRRLISKVVAQAIDAWPRPDQGIWESRGEPKHYVSSKLMIWVAVDRGARLAAHFGRQDLTRQYAETAAAIKREIIERGLKDGVFRQHYDTEILDASVLLMPLVRFLPPDDPRIVATVHAVRDGLSNRGLILRYLTEETDDGLHGREGTFLICSFWMVSALSEIGEPTEARRLCERLLSSAGSLNLFAEELDPDTNRHLGNFPQAFTHLALINAVSHVIADEQAERDPGEPTAVFSEMRD